jgi:hypothetical protein
MAPALQATTLARTILNKRHDRQSTELEFPVPAPLITMAISLRFLCGKLLP